MCPDTYDTRMSLGEPDQTVIEGILHGARRALGVAVSTLTLLLGPAAASADTLSGASLVGALREGGYVIVMRHASSPPAPPDKSMANPDNPKSERQLDENGRSAARSFGEALRKLRIPLGELLSSPTYRALETLRLADIGKPKTAPELNEGAEGMMASADPARSAWLRAKVAETPRKGTNTLIVTHSPNLTGAFQDSAARMSAGEALIFQPDGKGDAALVARLKIEEWSKLARAP
jgi:phosphohistidine phosphatase SixA